METSSTLILAVSAIISFALGRGVLHLFNSRRKAKEERLQKLQAQALHDAPPGPEPKNKSKRKRQARTDGRL